MSGVSCIYQVLAGRRLFDIGAEEDNKFAAPAEAGGADGKGSGFAKFGEEVKNAGFGYGLALVVQEGDHVGNYAEAREARKQGGLGKEYTGDVEGKMTKRAYIL